MSYQFFSRNGELLPVEQAVVPLDNIAYSYGFGVYETIRITNGMIYFLADHLERLVASAAVIQLDHHFDVGFIEAAIHELVEKNGAETCNLKLLLIGGNSADEAQLFIQCLNPLFPDRKLYQSGAHLVTEHYVRRYPQAKTLNMLPSYLAYRKAQTVGAYDALLLDHENYIREGTRTNFFVLKGKTLISPPEDKILPGVMRKVVLKVAGDNGYTVETRDIPTDKLSEFDAAFVTSVSSRIVPAKSIDDHEFGARPESLSELIRLTNEFLDECGGRLD